MKRHRLFFVLLLATAASCDESAGAAGNGASLDRPEPASDRPLSGGPELSLHLGTKDMKDPVEVGEEVELVFTLTNEDRYGSIFDPVIRYEMPEGFEWVASIDDAEFSPITRIARWRARNVARVPGEMIRRVTLRAVKPGWAVHRVIVGTADHPDVLLKDEPMLVVADGESGPALHLEANDDFRDPVRRGKQAQIRFTVRNEGSAPVENLVLMIEPPFGADPVYERVAVLKPGEAKILRSKVTATETGLHRFRCSARFDGFDGILLDEESVYITD